MKVRAFALLSIVFTLIGMVDNVRLVLTSHLDTPGFLSFDSITAFFSMISAVGVLFMLLALIELKATGTNPIFRGLTYLPVVGAVVLIIGYLWMLTGQPGSARYIGAFGQLLNQGGMLIVAILTLAAKRWLGWRKFTPLLYVLAIPVGAMVVSLTGLDGWFRIIIHLVGLLFGFALYTSQPMVESPHELAAVS